MTEITPLVVSADAHTMFRAVQSATSDPEIAQLVDAAFDEQTVAQTVDGVQGWIKGAIDSRMLSATRYAELAHAGHELEIEAATFTSTAGDAEVATGELPAIILAEKTTVSDETSIDDPAGLLLENDKYALDMQPRSIKGVEAHVALTALHAFARTKQDPAAAELWGRMSVELSRPARRLHESALRGSRLKTRFAGFLLRLAS